MVRLPDERGANIDETMGQNKSTAQMPPTAPGITIKSAPHGANGYNPSSPATTSEQLLQRSCSAQYNECRELLQSSFNFSRSNKPRIYASSNGLVHGTIAAYNQHHHLIIRPEDVWLAILTQFSCYVNAHAEELRGQFVAHEGKKELTLVMVGTRYTVDFGWFAEEMSRLLKENVVDATLRDWIMPAFSTTTKEDEVVAAIIMMGTLKKYFEFGCMLVCGLPSVTLLGTKEDWMEILGRLDKLKEYGEEPTIWYGLLKPVVTRFVQSFEHPESEEVLDFWQRIVHCWNMGSGPTSLSGWITAFCFWNEEGQLQYRDPGPANSAHLTLDPNHPFNHEAYGLSGPESGKKSKNQREKGWNDLQTPHLSMDGARYHTLDMDAIPAGYGSVPVRVDDNGYSFEALMIAGSVGIEASCSGKAMENGKIGIDTVQATSGWWMFEKKPS